MFLIGALIPTFIVSRLLLLVIAKLSGKKFYVSCNAVSLLLSALLFSFGAGENFPDFSTAFISGLTLYALPQFVWLAVDFIRFQRACRPVKDEKGEKKSSEEKKA